MKRAILAALLCVCGFSANAETSQHDGCEVRKIENSNAYYRVDSGCSFGSATASHSDPVAEVVIAPPPQPPAQPIVVPPVENPPPFENPPPIGNLPPFENPPGGSPLPPGGSPLPPGDAPVPPGDAPVPPGDSPNPSDGIPGDVTLS